MFTGSRRRQGGRERNTKSARTRADVPFDQIMDGAGEASCMYHLEIVEGDMRGSSDCALASEEITCKEQLLTR